MGIGLLPPCLPASCLPAQLFRLTAPTSQPACCPPLQVGLSEMKACIEHTGGYVVQTDTFTNPIFKDSLRRMFTPAGEEGYLGLSSNATFEVHCR